MDTNSAVAHRLHVAYKNSGMSFLQIAEKTGLPISAIHRIITGQNQKIDIDRMKLIAEALGVSPSFVMGWDVPDRNEYKLPLLGTIACGSPTFAEENFEGYITLPEPVKADFALRAKGDSMVGARIFDGDIVFIRRQPDVEDGEIAAVRIGDETTLKRIKHYPNRLILIPCNPIYQEIIFRDEELQNVTILGKAVWFLSEVRHG